MPLTDILIQYDDLSVMRCKVDLDAVYNPLCKRF